ncbi:hypothetical protein BDU57DRAFT_515145 [Ampelomyces quisqualis]|uniref:Uncharacterized protein n=1 Tax=Ampelomyces quisqualis TaxID=50730 RepID=A0A6A5QSN1_AMPQU|nr:hypothetical protein BDU57DRAFT_515145 [Ampelomyces quisqualis]
MTGYRRWAPLVTFIITSWHVDGLVVPLYRAILDIVKGASNFIPSTVQILCVMRYPLSYPFAARRLRVFAQSGQQQHVGGTRQVFASYCSRQSTHFLMPLRHGSIPPTFASVTAHDAIYEPPRTCQCTYCGRRI